MITFKLPADLSVVPLSALYQQRSEISERGRLASYPPIANACFTEAQRYTAEISSRPWAEVLAAMKDET